MRMSYFGDCRDVHYAEEKGNPGVCIHRVHDTHKCVFGHGPCCGRKTCIDRCHKKYHSESCPY